MHAVFRHDAKHHIRRLATKAFDYFVCMRIAEDVQLLLFDHDLRMVKQISGKPEFRPVRNNHMILRKPLGDDTGTFRSSNTMGRKTRNSGAAAACAQALDTNKIPPFCAASTSSLIRGMIFSAPGTYNFPPGSIKSCCASTSQKTI